ncbi:serine hydrolase [Streptomyces sp. NPDC012950]|uniref:serine hydrolase n=1 Tax=Streptomyces sp. NPDC012950 TaxID=3364858 RepID=UPI0036B85CB9
MRRPRSGRRCTPEEFHRRTHTTGFAVVHRGVLVHESHPGRFASPGARFELSSLTKSVTSMLVGIAREEGAPSLDDQAVSHLPEPAGSAYDGATVGHLLDMCSGTGVENHTDPDAPIGRFAPADDWRRTLETPARRMRAARLAQPRVALLSTTRASRRAAESRGADVVVGALRAAGFGERDAARYCRSLVDTALALSSYEAAAAALDGRSGEVDRMARCREYLAVPPALHPHPAAVAPYLAEADDDRFETALGLLPDAIAVRADAA